MRYDQPVTTDEQYNCEVCLARDLIKKENRICFKYNYHAKNETIDIGIPEDVLNDKGKKVGTDMALEQCGTIEEVLMAIGKIKTMKAAPLWTRLQMKWIPVIEGGEQVKREICPVALITGEASEWIMLEALCDKYKGAAVEMLKESEALLEPIIPFVFMVIAETKNKYEMMKMKSKKKEGGK